MVLVVNWNLFGLNVKVKVFDVKSCSRLAIQI